MSTETEPNWDTARLDYLRGEIEAERISYGEIEELQALGAEGLIPDDDVVLREWAGIPEFDDDDDHEHVAIPDKAGRLMVCTHCGVELRLVSPWEDPANWAGMSVKEYAKARKWVPADVTTEDQERGL